MQPARECHARLDRRERPRARIAEGSELGDQLLERRRAPRALGVAVAQVRDEVAEVALVLRTTRRERTRLLEPALELRNVREVGGPHQGLTPAEVARRYLERFGPREAVLVVAEPREVDRPLALAASAPFEDPLTGEVSAVLVLLYTDPSIRQRGVARALAQELRRVLASRGVTELWARAAHNDDALISMGERWGFVRAWELMSAE